MKRRTFIREIVLLSAAPLLWLPRKSKAQPGWSASDLSTLTPSVTPPSSCTTLKLDYSGGGTGDSRTTANSSSFIYLASAFGTTGGFTCCAASAWLERIGSPSGTLTAEIWSDAAGSPSAIVGSSSNTVNISSVPTSQTETSFTGISAALSASTSYWLVLRSSFTPSGTDGYYLYRRDVSATIKKSSSGSSWSTETSARRTKLKLFSA